MHVEVEHIRADEITQLRMRDARGLAADREHGLDLRIQEALAQDALPHHTRRAKENNLHARTRPSQSSRPHKPRISYYRAMSVKAQPILAVRDVRASARWYARILGSAEPNGSPPSDHEHIYRRIYVGDELVLQL